MALKQFNVKSAERWLQKLKGENLQSYKDTIKFLRKYQKTEDQHDCYLKVSHTLLAHSELAKEINGYLEDGNRFIIPKADDEKLREFLSYVKLNRDGMFDRIITMIQELKAKGGPDIERLIIPNLKEIIRGDEELEKKYAETIDMTEEQLIKNKNLEHLKVVRPLPQIQEEHKDIHFSQNTLAKDRRPAQEPKMDLLTVDRKEKPKVPILTGNFSSTIEERVALDQLQRSLERKDYRFLIKIVKLYFLNIFTRKEAIGEIRKIALEEVHFDNLKEIMDTRELDRRKHSYFRPLSDINFSKSERTSPSYVTMPFFYPIRCSGKTAKIKVLTNDKWISVPYGSEENENFSVRNKNINEINLLKAEDERYEYDLYVKKLTMSKILLDRYLDDSVEMDPYRRKGLMNRAISLGIVQILYKNCKDEQKEELESFLKDNPYETCKLFKYRLEVELNELRSIREVHAIKAWNETASKNYSKGLDVKGFEFKKNEKDKMKNQFFVAELNERNKILANGGEVKQTSLSFDEKKAFFTILNSFQSSSKKEKCDNRQLPAFESFPLEDEAKRPFYPIMIMAFEDEEVCQSLYSFLIFFMESSPLSEFEKVKHKMFLESFLINYLQWKLPVRKTLNEHFVEEQLVHKIYNQEAEYHPERYLQSIQEQAVNKPVQKRAETESKQKKTPTMQILTDEPSRYLYLPHKSQQSKVIYGSDHLYCLTRFLYAIYERMIKMKEVSKGTDRVALFELLFHASIKVKESIRFEENLNTLFGDQAYLFSTLYKLFDSLIKSVATSSNCLLTSSAFKLTEQGLPEDHELLLINRLCQQSSLTTSRIVRFSFNQDSRVLYINYFDSYYRAEDQSKEMCKKRGALGKDIQTFTVDNFDSNKDRKVTRRVRNCLIRNQLEFTFESSNFKILNHGSNEDLIMQRNKPPLSTRMIERQLKRAHHINAMIK